MNSYSLQAIGVSLLVFGVPLLAVLSVVAAVIWASNHRLWSDVSKSGLVVAISPGLVMLISFYALALHMYLSLGGWPESIGTEGLPSALMRHVEVNSALTGALLLAFLGMPLWLLICVAVSRLRRYLPRLIIGGAAFLLCFIAMQFGLLEFVYWWWD